MHKISFDEMHCSIGRSLEVVGQWWSPLIVRDIYLGLHRFDEITENLGISRNMLTTRLTQLVDGGVLERRSYQQRPQRFEYHLTQAGRELVPILTALMAWGDKWQTPAGGPPMILTHTGCGEVTAPTVACSACGEPLTAQDLRTHSGPGAAGGPGTVVLARRAREAE